MTWLAVTVVLLAILLANQLARVLSQAAANDFPREVVFALIGLTTTGNLSVIVPIGFFLAIMLALGRLYHESEMAAIQSCGVGPSGLFRPIALLGVVIVVLLAWLSFCRRSRRQARERRRSGPRPCARRSSACWSLDDFGTFAGGNVVFYAERVDENGILHNVNVFVERPPRSARKAEDDPAARRSIRDLGRDPRGAARRRAGRADLRALRRASAMKACPGAASSA